MTFPFPLMMPGGKATVVHTADTENSADQTSYTFSSQSLGAAASTRIVLVTVIGQGNNRTISSVTVAGSSATVIAGASVDTANDIHAIYAVALPTGTTGDVVVTFSGAVSRAGIGVDAVYGANATPLDTLATSGSGTSLSDTIDVPDNGIIVGGGAGVGDPNFPFTAGLDSEFDTDMEGANAPHSGGTKEFTTGQTGLTLTCATGNPLSRSTMVAVSYGPA